jgi:hypothetical protein
MKKLESLNDITHDGPNVAHLLDQSAVFADVDWAM